MDVGLVLGGGGARGFAHLGVLRAMQERNLEPVAIAGCSMGGIVGALVAHGHDADYIADVFHNLNPVKLIDKARMGAILGGHGVAHQMGKHLPATFEELGTPLRVTAVDVQQGRPVTLYKGELIPALLATCALPGIFSPVEIEDSILVDGGLLANVPVEEMRSMTRCPVIAVDVTVPPSRTLPFEDNRSFWERLKEPFTPGTRPLFVELLIKAYDIPAAVLNDMRIAAFRPEILIRPPLDPHLKVEDFHRLDEAAEIGYNESVRVLDEHPLLESS